MVFQIPKIWNLAGDGFQILLCLLMLSFFIKNRIIEKKTALNIAKGTTGKNFDTHIFSITVEQQLNQAFTNIIENIASERNALECALGLNSPHYQDEGISMVRANTQLSDVNAKQQIFEIIWQQARMGESTIFVSTELEELLEVCHRILIMRHGQIVDEVYPSKINITDLYELCMRGE